MYKLFIICLLLTSCAKDKHNPYIPLSYECIDGVTWIVNEYGAVNTGKECKAG